MTRKDTIIIASLVNGILLLVLFLTGVQTTAASPQVEAKKVEKVEAKGIAFVEPIAIAPAPKQEVKTAQGDEIDQLLRQFAQQQHQMEKQVEKAAPQVDLVKEIEAITKGVQEVRKPQESAPASEHLQVVVKKGDVLEKIARAHQTSVKEIMDLNKLPSTMLRIGQVLKIPSKKGAKSQPVAAVSSKAEYYTVKTGDSPWSIAVKHQLKVDELLRLNNLNEEKARQLKPGDQLRIR